MGHQEIAKGIIDSNRSAVATPHPDAVESARRVFASGGNAIDAAVAAMATVCVAIPSAVGLAGYGGSLVAYLAKENRVVCLDFDSRAPLAYRDDFYIGHPETQKTGYLAVTVPGVLAGLDMALREWGTISWETAAAHSIEVAERGMIVDAEIRRHLSRLEQFADERAIHALFPAGKTPQVGERWVQNDMANFLRRLAKEGPRSLYDGDIAQEILKQLRAGGSIVSAEDFRTYRPTIEQPLRATYRGYDIITPPPPSGGLTSLQILKVLERFDIAGMKPCSADYFHHFAEASKLCWLDRARAIGDPDFVSMPLAEMLSEKSADEKAARVRSGHITSGGVNVLPGGPHTANISAIDSHGNIVSITATQGFLFGSGVVIEGMGLIMGHGMSRFDFVPGHPNAPKPGKRMHHNMSPVIITQNSKRLSCSPCQPSLAGPLAGRFSDSEASVKPIAALGLPGGTKIVSVTAQLVIDLIDFHMTPDQAVTTPRVHSETEEPIAVSADTPGKVVEELSAMGHQVRLGQDVGGPPTWIGGQANMIAVTADGKMSAASGAGKDAATTW